MFRYASTSELISFTALFMMLLVYSNANDSISLLNKEISFVQSTTMKILEVMEIVRLLWTLFINCHQFKIILYVLGNDTETERKQFNFTSEKKKSHLSNQQR